LTRIIKITTFESIANTELAAKYTVVIMQEMLNHLAKHHDVVIRVKPMYRKESETEFVCRMRYGLAPAKYEAPRIIETTKVSCDADNTVIYEEME